MALHYEKVLPAFRVLQFGKDGREWVKDHGRQTIGMLQGEHVHQHGGGGPALLEVI